MAEACWYQHAGHKGGNVLQWAKPQGMRTSLAPLMLVTNATIAPKCGAMSSWTTTEGLGSSLVCVCVCVRPWGEPRTRYDALAHSQA